MVGEDQKTISEQPSGLSLIEEARKERLALEKLRDEVAAQTKELAELHAKNMMQGSAIASIPTPKPKTEEDIAQEMADETIKRLLGKSG